MGLFGFGKKEKDKMKDGLEDVYKRQALASAERAPLHDFDTGAEQSARPDPDAHGKKADTVTVYEGCMPIEIMAARGADTMRFGPLRPVGLVDPRTGHRPWACLLYTSPVPRSPCGVQIPGLYPETYLLRAGVRL